MLKPSTFPTVDQFAELARQAWCAQTSACPEKWSISNPALGQGVPTTALAQRLFGGKVLWSRPQLPDGGLAGSHYFNDYWDYTCEQYREIPTIFPAAQERSCGLGSTYNYMCSFPDTMNRVACLVDRFNGLGVRLPVHEWLLCDFDEALEHVQKLNNSARYRLAEYLAPGDINRQEHIVGAAVITHADLTDQSRPASAHEGFALAQSRFQASLLTTMMQYRPEATAADLQQVLTISETAFEPDDHRRHMLEVMNEGRMRGCKVGIITRGDNKVQRARLAELPFMNLADAVLVTPIKNVPLLKNFMKAHGARTAVHRFCWVDV